LSGNKDDKFKFSLIFIDAGWYGKGCYFTSSADYAASMYAKPNPNGEMPLLISYIQWSNCYPVIENPTSSKEFLGAHIKSGYDMHYTVSIILNFISLMI
jgi:hypothetical protein